MIEPLSYFVKYKELVDSLAIDTESASLISILENTIASIKTNENELAISELKTQQYKIVDALDGFNKLLTQYKRQVANEVRVKEKAYLSKSYKIYNESRGNDTPEYILSRYDTYPLFPDKRTKKHFTHVISNKCTWKHPGLIIRPGNCEFLDPLVSLDPLYIVDEDNLLFGPVRAKWNETYQSRLIYKLVSEDSEAIFKDFPIEQISFVLAVGFFNYKPLEVIKNYSTEIFNLLKPGGSMLFTYNNCDLANAVRNFENILYSYTPAELLLPMLVMLGFEIEKKYSDPNSNLNWVLIKKPGNLETLRGGQCLGKINV